MIKIIQLIFFVPVWLLQKLYIGFFRLPYLPSAILGLFRLAFFYFLGLNVCELNYYKYEIKCWLQNWFSDEASSNFVSIVGGVCALGIVLSLLVIFGLSQTATFQEEAE